MDPFKVAGFDRLSSKCRELNARAEIACAAARTSRAGARQSRLRAIEIRYAVRRSRHVRCGRVFALAIEADGTAVGETSTAKAVGRIRHRAALLSIWTLTSDPVFRTAIETELYGAPDTHRAQEEVERLAGLPVAPED